MKGLSIDPSKFFDVSPLALGQHLKIQKGLPANPSPIQKKEGCATFNHAFNAIICQIQYIQHITNFQENKSWHE